MKIIDMGLMDYAEAREMQKEVLKHRKKGRAPDTLIIGEHFPVFTLGKTGSYDNLLVDSNFLKRKNIKIIEANRGGDITFHGHGQIVLYPIIHLKENSLDVHKYIRALEELAIEFLIRYGIKGERAKGFTGIWVEDKKIASIGIGVSNWVTYHGISINVNTDLGFFSMIRACGIQGVGMTSLANILNKTIDINQAKKQLVSVFENVFNKCDERAAASPVA